MGMRTRRGRIFMVFLHSLPTRSRAGLTSLQAYARVLRDLLPARDVALDHRPELGRGHGRWLRANSRQPFLDVGHGCEFDERGMELFNSGLGCAAWSEHA